MKLSTFNIYYQNSCLNLTLKGCKIVFLFSGTQSSESMFLHSIFVEFFWDFYIYMPFSLPCLIHQWDLLFFFKFSWEFSLGTINDLQDYEIKMVGSLVLESNFTFNSRVSLQLNVNFYNWKTKIKILLHRQFVVQS